MSSRSVTIVLTNKCNLNCVYCYETNKSDISIEESVLLDIIRKEMNTADKKVSFNLFGGEPFLRFDLIHATYDYLYTHYNTSLWEIGLITNGTLVHGKIQHWLRERNKQIVCTLSLDGKKDIQDRNRNSSYDNIDIDFFVNTFPKPYAKMTVSPYTLSNLAENIIFLQDLGFLVNCSLGYGYAWSPQMRRVFSEELAKYFNTAFENDYNREKCSLLSFPYKEIYHSENVFYRNCDAGHDSHTYNTDGKKYPCHMFLPNGFSDEDMKAVDKISFPGKVVPLDKIDNACIKCPIHSVCQSCYANNFRKSRNIFKQDEDICKANKILFRQKAEYYARCWHAGKLELDPSDEYMLLTCLMRVLSIKGGTE